MASEKKKTVEGQKIREKTKTKIVHNPRNWKFSKSPIKRMKPKVYFFIRSPGPDKTLFAETVNSRLCLHPLEEK